MTLMSRLVSTLALFTLVSWIPSRAQAAEPTLRWLGHAAFEFTTRNGKVFLIDPWLTNPKAPKDAAPQTRRCGACDARSLRSCRRGLSAGGQI
jgi:hypothetical protein